MRTLFTIFFYVYQFSYSHYLYCAITQNPKLDTVIHIYYCYYHNEDGIIRGCTLHTQHKLWQVERPQMDYGRPSVLGFRVQDSGLRVSVLGFGV